MCFYWVSEVLSNFANYMVESYNKKSLIGLRWFRCVTMLLIFDKATNCGDTFYLTNRSIAGVFFSQ